MIYRQAQDMHALEDYYVLNLYGVSKGAPVKCAGGSLFSTMPSLGHVGLWCYPSQKHIHTLCTNVYRFCVTLYYYLQCVCLCSVSQLFGCNWFVVTSSTLYMGHFNCQHGHATTHLCLIFLLNLWTICHLTFQKNNYEFIMNMLVCKIQTLFDKPVKKIVHSLSCMSFKVSWQLQGQAHVTPVSVYLALNVPGSRT